MDACLGAPRSERVPKRVGDDFIEECALDQSIERFPGVPHPAAITMVEQKVACLCSLLEQACGSVECVVV